MFTRGCSSWLLGVLAGCGPAVDDSAPVGGGGTEATGDATSTTDTPGTSAGSGTPGSTGTSGVDPSGTSGAVDPSTSTSDPFEDGCDSYLDCPEGQACYDPGVYYENYCVDAECIFDEDCPAGSRCNHFPHESDAGECGAGPSASLSDSGETGASSSEDSGTSDDTAGSSESGSTS